MEVHERTVCQDNGLLYSTSIGVHNGELTEVRTKHGVLFSDLVNMVGSSTRDKLPNRQGRSRKQGPGFKGDVVSGVLDIEMSLWSYHWG